MMTANLINGRRLADEILEELAKKKPPEKKLAAVLVGDNLASLSFLRRKEEAARRVGIAFTLRSFSVAISETELAKEVSRLGAEETIGGIVLQLPLPRHIRREKIIEMLSVEKDVDNLTGRASVLQPSARAVEEIARAHNLDLGTLHAAVIGQGLLIGAPITRFLTGRVRALTAFDVSNQQWDAVKTADLVVTGTGVPELLRGELIKERAAVVDFGYGRTADGKLSGDVHMPSVASRAALVTPTPGGTGPLVIACLLRNFFELNGVY